jgi:hypothetical protein
MLASMPKPQLGAEANGVDNILECAMVDHA